MTSDSMKGERKEGADNADVETERDCISNWFNSFAMFWTVQQRVDALEPKSLTAKRFLSRRAQI